MRPAVPTEDTIGTYQAGFTWLSRPDIISIAAVAGHAVGAGFQLALACDLRVLADDAQFTMAEVSRGLVPDLTGTEALVHHIGYARALELCLTCRRVGAAEAKELGLANLVVPRDQLEQATGDLVAALLAASRQASVETKALLLRARQQAIDPAGQHRAEREAQRRVMLGIVGGGDVAARSGTMGSWISPSPPSSKNSGAPSAAGSTTSWCPAPSRTTGRSAFPPRRWKACAIWA